MRVEYIDHMGSDLRVVNAARVSFDKMSDWECNPMKAIKSKDQLDKRLTSKDEKLINYLAKHNHWTPFSHPQITLRETVPIFVARQRFKHMVGFTYNEVSRRYVDDPPEFDMIMWRKRAENKKQGSAEEFPIEEAANIDLIYLEAVGFAEKAYQDLLDKGVAPEQARAILPQSMMTNYFVTGSLAAWARAYKLRIDTNLAQVEIATLAKKWDKIIAPLFPVSWKALTT